MTHQPVSNVPENANLVTVAQGAQNEDTIDFPASSSDSASDDRSLASLLRMASEISGQVNAILDPDVLLNTVIPLLKDGFGLYYVHVYMLDFESRELRLRAGYGEAGQQMLARGHRIALDADRSLVARAARDRVPVVVNDVRKSPGFLPNPLLPDTMSELALPMVVGNAVLGVFDIQDAVLNAFPPLHVDVYFVLAGQIATALQNARFVERVEQSLYQTQVRYQISRVLSAAQTQVAVLDVIVKQAAAREGIAIALALNVAGAQTPTLTTARVNSAEGVTLPAELTVGCRTAARDHVFAPLVATEREFLCMDVAKEPRFSQEMHNRLLEGGVKSLFVLPLALGKARLGLLVAVAARPGAFDEGTRLLYRVLAEQGASSLHRAHLRDQLSLTQFSVDNAPAAIMWLRPDGSLHSVNDTACDLLDYSRTELLSLPEISAVDPNMIPSVWRVHWQKVKAEQRFVIETEYRTKVGKLVPVEVTANYLSHDDQEFNCVFARDVSERKQAEAARDRFTVQLRTAADISEQVGAILDPDKLLAAVIPLLKERFELYHAHVYVLTGEDLVLRSGYGRIGAIMVQQGHRIPLHHPHSLVARAAQSREAVVANDVTSAPDFLPNLLLPRTQSEVAVPIVIGEQVLGVFDVQSDRLNAFGETDLDVFRTLSGQLANSLYSALLFERQQATEKELRASAETVRAVFDAVTEGILVTDMLGRIVDVNEAALSLFGYDARADLVGRSSMELVTRSGWARMSESLQRALEMGSGPVQEYTMLRQDGSSFDAEQASALLWDDAGEPRGIVSITRDVTERKRAGREIARFQALAENAVDAIMMTDFTGHVTYANPASTRLFGFDGHSESIVGVSLAELWAEEDVSTLLMEVLPAAGDAGWQGEAAQIRRDGTKFQASLTFFSVMDELGSPISAATIVRDITDRKRSEAELRQYAVQLRTASDVSAQVNAILDPTALLEAIVPLVQERFNLYHLHVYTLDVIRKQLVMRVGSGEAGRLMRGRGHEIALDKEPSLVAKAARSRETVVVDDVAQAPAFLPNPLLPLTRSEVAIPLLVGDEVIGVLDVQDDVPGRFGQTEIDVLKTLAGQIAIALRNAQSFEELQTVARRLREVDRLKSEFLANMSHELRTPLNSILGYAEVMLMGIDGELSGDMEEDVTAIFENGQQLLKLINDILDLTRVEAGRLRIVKESVDVALLLEQAKTHNQGLLLKQPKPVEIVVSATPDLPMIVVDPVRFAQILNNLVSNAIKFTDRGQVVLFADHDKAAERLIIEVRDTGVGIAEEDIGGLFERFHQVDGSSTRRAEGTGLGLAISKHLVELHGGELTVESKGGVGSTFAILIPVA
jgi:PAS domain S-box-containing protein